MGILHAFVMRSRSLVLHKFDRISNSVEFYTKIYFVLDWRSFSPYNN